MSEPNKPFFAPQLYIKNGIRDISFYTKAFGAIELRRFSNDDGSIHVAELSINGSAMMMAVYMWLNFLSTAPCSTCMKKPLSLFYSAPRNTTAQLLSSGYLCRMWMHI